MNQGAFRSNPDVAAFVNWMRQLPQPDTDRTVITNARHAITVAEQQAMRALPPIMVRLNIAHSRFVPGGLQAYAPLSALPLLYVWCAPGVDSGDFHTTSGHLAGLAASLQQAVCANDALATLNACSAILRWGGERNMRHGARPFLAAFGKSLPGYLWHCARQLDLAAVTLAPDGSLPGFTAMNSMLVKVHSLMAMDGLPIYDSRVAGALATLVETWRVSTGRTASSLPVELIFPAIPPNAARRVSARFPGACSPGQLVYGAQTSPPAWAGATVRAGWLLREMLGSSASPLATRAMEAALFMAGYNCAGIAQPLPGLAERRLAA